MCLYISGVHMGIWICMGINFQWPNTSKTLFPLSCMSNCQSLFIEKEMEGESVLAVKFSSSLFILVIGLHLWNIRWLIRDLYSSLTDLISKHLKALLWIHEYAHRMGNYCLGYSSIWRGWWNLVKGQEFSPALFAQH